MADANSGKDISAITRELEALRRELTDAREALVELPIVRYRAVLTSYKQLKRGDRLGKWLDEVAAQIIGMFKAPRDVAPDPHATVRVLCPLCGDGGEHIYGVGYVFPEGLRRHLAGGTNAHFCEVVKAAKELAAEHLAREAKQVHG